MKKGWVQRELYLERIRPFYDSELIKVITGVRRCGKSILLKQIRQELLDTGIELERITYLNFEDYELRALKNPDTFHAHMVGLLKPGMKHYLLCDEIQNVEDFELVVNSLRSTSDVSIFLTGSNARLLSGELATHLGGRTISLKMMSFSFSEFCTFSELPPDKSSLNEYMK
ncbi:MAG TPA: AAA family ATPase, partial [Sphaerochaeta sp.]|nr:AAA family ATPase [Sphaerochaeta sp.]